jgi:hypothetical protein
VHAPAAGTPRTANADATARSSRSARSGVRGEGRGAGRRQARRPGGSPGPDPDWSMVEAGSGIGARKERTACGEWRWSEPA